MSNQERIPIYDFILPDEASNFFRAKRQTIKWAVTPEKARNSIIRVITLTLIIISSLFFISVKLGPPCCHSPLHIPYWFVFVFFTFLASMTIFSAILDFASMWVALENFESETISYDIGNLSLESDAQQFVESRHSFARLRVAPILAFNLCIRIAVIGFLGGFLLIVAILHPVAFFTEDVIIVVSFAIPIIIFYLFEPVWRVKVITALGLAFSSKSQRYISRLLISVFGLLCFWLSQLIVLGLTSLFAALVFLAPVIVNNFFVKLDQLPDLLFYIIIFVLSFTFIINIRWFYLNLTKRFLTWSR